MSWLSGWSYKRPITIDNSSNSNALTDYQIRIDLTSSNFNFAKAKSDGADIRFTDSDGVTLLSYWIESWDNSGETATIWVKVPSVPASSTKTIYMYYGNSGATSESDGESTFEFFDDFDTNTRGQYTIDAGIFVWDTANSRLRTDAANENRMRKNSLNIGVGHAIMLRETASLYASNYKNPAILFAYQNSDNFYMGRESWHSNTEPIQFYKKVGGSFTKLATATLAEDPIAMQWYVLEVAWISASRVKVFLDRELKLDITSDLESWTSGDVGIRDYLTSEEHSYFDWYIIRKYTDSEPSASVEAEIENVLRNALFYSMNF